MGQGLVAPIAARTTGITAGTPALKLPAASAPTLSTTPALKLPSAPAPASTQPTSFAAKVAEAPTGKLAEALTPGVVNRETYTAKNKELPDGELGTLVRKEGQGPSGDKAVDWAHDNAGTVYDFYKNVLGRDSLDGQGMVLKSTAHFGKNFNNAYWDGTHMTYGDGDGRVFTSFSQALDVVGHEMTHGVTERTSGLNYENQPGALNESWSDVMGELIQQWKADPNGFKTADYEAKQDWLIGSEIFTPGKDGDALRSLKNPGTAYNGDPQPADMAHYKRLPNTQDGDWGGVHTNSGIPNKAAELVATKLGGEKTAQIWYKAMTSYLKPNSQFTDAANATLSAARDLFQDGAEAQAVKDAWNAVGLKSKFVNPLTQRQLDWRARKAADNLARGGGDPHRDGVVPPWLLSSQTGTAPKGLFAGT